MIANIPFPDERNVIRVTLLKTFPSTFPLTRVVSQVEVSGTLAPEESGIGSLSRASMNSWSKLDEIRFGPAESRLPDLMLIL